MLLACLSGLLQGTGEQPGILAQKISGNRERDLKVTRQLEETGWLVLRFWEHEVRKNTEPVMEVIGTALAER